MTGGIVPIRILVLHTFDNVRDYLAETFHSSLRLLNHEVDVFDGNNLDHETVLALLKKNYDFIFLNLQLPSGLSVRMAELAQLAKVQTRLVLTSFSSGSMVQVMECRALAVAGRFPRLSEYPGWTTVSP